MNDDQPSIRPSEAKNAALFCLGIGTVIGLVLGLISGKGAGRDEGFEQGRQRGVEEGRREQCRDTRQDWATGSSCPYAGQTLEKVDMQWICRCPKGNP